MSFVNQRYRHVIIWKLVSNHTDDWGLGHNDGPAFLALCNKCFFQESR